MFIHTLPTTRPVSFSDQLISSSLSLEVTQTTEKRSRLVDILKDIKQEKTQTKGKGGYLSEGNGHGSGGGNNAISGDGRGGADEAPPLLTQKDWLKIVQAAEDYLPSLYALDRCLKTDDVIGQSELVFSWKETLTASPNKAPMPGLGAELLNIVVLNAKASCNLSASLVASLGSYEYTEAATLSEEERARKEERLKFGADLLCRAAGMFEFAGNEVVQEWENNIGTSRLSQLGRSAEMTREMCFALARLAQAEAELLVIRKVLSPTLCYQTATRTSYPPLPSGHPSASLLSKLYLNAASLFESAFSLAKTSTNAIGVRLEEHTPNNANTSDDKKRPAPSLKARLSSKLSSSSKASVLEETLRSGKLTSSFIKYLTKSVLACQARAYIWLAIDKGERGQYGEALGFLRLSREEAEGIAQNKKLGGLASMSDDRKRDERRKFTRERDAILLMIQAWQQSYTQLNNTVGFQPTPQSSSLSSQIPAGRGATIVKPYKLPVPAFGPGSVGFVSEGMERWQGINEGDLFQGRTSGIQSGANEAEYAGTGAYY